MSTDGLNEVMRSKQVSNCKGEVGICAHVL